MTRLKFQAFLSKKKENEQMCHFATNDEREYISALFDSVRNYLVLQPIFPVTISEMPCGHFGTCFRPIEQVKNDIHNSIQLEDWHWLAKFERQWLQRVKQDDL